MIKHALIGAVVFATAAFFAGHGHAQQATLGTLHRVDLQRHDLSAPGWEAIQVRVDFPPGTDAPNHKHPGEEIIYVLQGTLEYKLEGQPAAVYKVGEVLTVPAGVAHSVKNLDKGTSSELATYVVPKGKPLIELVK